MTAIDVLQEFVADCEAAYPAFDGSPEFVASAISDEWPDLASTYLHAKDVLAGVLTTLYEPAPELTVYKTEQEARGHVDTSWAPRHLCDTCDKEIPTCDAKDIVWSIDRNPRLKGADADRVVECNCWMPLGASTTGEQA